MKTFLTELSLKVSLFYSIDVVRGDVDYKLRIDFWLNPISYKFVNLRLSTWRLVGVSFRDAGKIPREVKASFSFCSTSGRSHELGSIYTISRKKPLDQHLYKKKIWNPTVTIINIWTIYIKYFVSRYVNICIIFKRYFTTRAAKVHYIK